MNANTGNLESHQMQSFGKEPRRRSFAAIFEAFIIAVDSIWSHKMRSILTLLGIIIGVASVVAVGGAIEGLGYYVKDRLSATFGSNTFILARLVGMNRSDEEWEKAIKRNKRLYVDDLRSVEERCDGCEAVVPMLRRRDDAKVGNRTFYDAEVSGVSEDLGKVQDLEVEFGRFLSNVDVEHARPVAVIGADVRKELFGPVDALGKEIRLGGDSLMVVGVEKSRGSFFGQSMDNGVYIPYSLYLKKYGNRQSIGIRVKAPSAETIEGAQDEVRVIMRSRHHLRPNQEDDFDILGSKAMQESVGQFTGAIAAVVTPITLISLVVGGIVIMNIMLVTVTERTTEVGMRKAVGARRKDIMLQFLIESALLASVGGAIGLLLGYGIAVIVRNTTPIPMNITIGYILLSLAASGGIGIISGIYPAHKAAKLDPIVALSRD
jgi:putative ABC transport system permease protein